MYNTLIIGDSNLLHIGKDIYNGLLQHHDIDVYAERGFRALFLENHLERGLNYTHVIVICGTNDLGKHPRNKNLLARSSEETSQSLIKFHNFLWNRNVECYIVGQWIGKISKQRTQRWELNRRTTSSNWSWCSMSIAHMLLLGQSKRNIFKMGMRPKWQTKGNFWCVLWY